MDLLAHIETFVTVADEHSFTRAAARLDLPQPLLSRRVKALERSWGGALLRRTPRRMELTPLGELVLPYARDVLQRTRHLHDVLDAARASVVHALGIPPGCPPRALAAVIREAGATVALHEASAADRRDGLRDGRLAAAVVRVAPEDAPLRVLGGIARVPSPEAPAPPRPVHLDALRPHRGRGRAAGVLLLTPEDDLEPFADRLRRAAARAGLSATAITGVASIGAGAAQVLAGDAGMVCDERSARVHGLAWAPFADATLHRGYELAAGSAGGLGAAALARLSSPLARAIGAADAGGEADRSPADGPATDRLAARG